MIGFDRLAHVHLPLLLQQADDRAHHRLGDRPPDVFVPWTHARISLVNYLAVEDDDTAIEVPGGPLVESHLTGMRFRARLADLGVWSRLEFRDRAAAMNQRVSKKL